MSHRDWYIAPRLEQAEIIDDSDPDNPVLVQELYIGPASGSPLAPAPQPSMICRAYSVDEGTVLVGLMRGTTVMPADWTAQTVEEARSHFFRIMGFPAKPEDIE